MIDGFWIVQFEGVQGNGGGVVIFTKGHVLGGDSGYIYTGMFQANGQEVTATVDVRNFLPAVPSVLGITGNFKLNVKATFDGAVVRGSASLVGQPGAGIVIKLTRVGDLPA